MKSFLLLIFVMVISYSCIETTTSRGTAYITAEVTADSEEMRETREEVVQNSLTSREKLQRERNLEIARNNYTNDPDDLDNIIWYGRRLAYLGKYQEAISIYTTGLQKHPNSYRLLRHRGHRYITIRRFDDAVNDLQTAAFYVRNEPVEIEQDGIPNAYNRPLSNNKFNIWYHLGLAYYLTGNYDKAISSYKKCLEFSSNEDLKVATTNWLYNTYLKIGNISAAESLANEISSRMKLIENRAYHDLVMLYRGFVTPELLIERNTSGGTLDATVGYGIGNYYLYNGKIQKAIEIFTRIVESDQWDSFGYIAAEVELENLNNDPL